MNHWLPARIHSERHGFGRTYYFMSIIFFDELTTLFPSNDLATNL
jgi:hypothetical protein